MEKEDMGIIHISSDKEKFEEEFDKITDQMYKMILDLKDEELIKLKNNVEHTANVLLESAKLIDKIIEDRNRGVD